MVLMQDLRKPKDPDIVSLVLTSLKESDIELLAELASLGEAGFDEEQTAQMMTGNHKSAMEAVATFQERYAAIVEARKPKPRAPKKQRKPYTRKT